MRRGYLQEPVETIYFGGGTPSLISGREISKMLTEIEKLSELEGDVEITLEANPEDLSTEKCIELKEAGINRLSIGFQTFDDIKLQWMNRAHCNIQSQEAYENARKVGFENISIDLMYALPDESPDLFISDLKKLIQLGPEHISLYGLTIEDRTVFGRQKKKGILIEMPEEQAAHQYLEAISLMKAHNYYQYEVSNFGKEGFHSRHNLNYWNHRPYLGVGPGAHSYNQSSRRFNIRSNPKYVKAIQGTESYFEEEILSEIQQLNERILTGLRTADGINTKVINEIFKVDVLADHQGLLADLDVKNLINIEDSRIQLKPEGFLVADSIALQLFYDE